ncbi:MAG: hypothetical protein FRX49_09319 [Trebouxia sp. A1-2]|nr:MAG: hypothetical protein FRX49_09319 [Trebouxia sp. A1-2]
MISVKSDLAIINWEENDPEKCKMQSTVKLRILCIPGKPNRNTGREGGPKLSEPTHKPTWKFDQSFVPPVLAIQRKEWRTLTLLLLDALQLSFRSNRKHPSAVAIGALSAVWQINNSSMEALETQPGELPDSPMTKIKVMGQT